MRYETYHTSVGDHSTVPTKNSRYRYDAELDPDKLTGEALRDIELIFGVAWRRIGGRWDSRAEQYLIHDIEQTDTGVMFKVDHAGRPSHRMWVDGYFVRGPW